MNTPDQNDAARRLSEEGHAFRERRETFFRHGGYDNEPQQIIEPRQITVKVQHLSAETMRECDEIVRKRNLRILNNDPVASAFYDANRLTPADIDDMEHRGEARPHFTQHTNPHE